MPLLISRWWGNGILSSKKKSLNTHHNIYIYYSKGALPNLTGSSNHWTYFNPGPGEGYEMHRHLQLVRFLYCTTGKTFHGVLWWISILYSSTLRSNIARESSQLIDDFPIQTSICGGFPIAIFDSWRVSRWDSALQKRWIAMADLSRVVTTYAKNKWIEYRICPIAQVSMKDMFKYPISGHLTKCSPGFNPSHHWTSDGQTMDNK